ncbi:MAG: Na+/H+ antiporter subunit E [Rhizobiaceae bacterium]|nr:Na+/H+ antiporter subunit E [Rhizobiaceae bacterium]
MTRYLGVALLALVWMAVTGSASIPNLLFGLALGALALSLVRGRVASRVETVRPVRAAVLAAIFVRELVLSGCRVARIVMSPRMQLNPAIFAYPLKVDRDFEITLLANLITLTPGTLSVDVSDDGKVLFVHALDARDPEQACRDIEQAFERRILEAFRR